MFLVITAHYTDDNPPHCIGALHCTDDTLHVVLSPSRLHYTDNIPLRCIGILHYTAHHPRYCTSRCTGCAQIHDIINIIVRLSQASLEIGTRTAPYISNKNETAQFVSIKENSVINFKLKKIKIELAVSIQ